jgi:hypothetical protein
MATALVETSAVAGRGERKAKRILRFCPENSLKYQNILDREWCDETLQNREPEGGGLCQLASC